MLETMKKMLEENAFCVLATCSNDKPHCSLMSYAFDAERMEMYLVTRGDTRKFSNVSANPEVSLLVDSRSGGTGAENRAMALTVSGTVDVLFGDAVEQAARRALAARHAGLAVFLDDPGARVMRVKIMDLQLLDGPVDSHRVTIGGR